MCGLWLTVPGGYGTGGIGYEKLSVSGWSGCEINSFEDLILFMPVNFNELG